MQIGHNMQLHIFNQEIWASNVFNVSYVQQNLWEL